MAIADHDLPHPDDLLAFMLKYLRGGHGAVQGVRPLADCDLRLYEFADRWIALIEPHRRTADDFGEQKNIIAHAALEVAWGLIRRGFLHPGGLRIPDANAGDPGRFSLTTSGRDWLKTADESHDIILMSSRLAEQFQSFAPKFSEGFSQRAKEAVRCREADAYLACSVMCGAAAESILLSVAYSKTKDIEQVDKTYRSSSGRSRLLSQLVGQATKPVQDGFKKRIEVIGYWRDDAGHGMPSSISAPIADSALRELLLLCQFVTANWDPLTL